MTCVQRSGFSHYLLLFVLALAVAIVVICRVEIQERLFGKQVSMYGDIPFKTRIASKFEMPPITDIPVIKVSEVSDEFDELQGDSLVLGVTINGESRAYPLNQLIGPQREVFNDFLGGQAIMATW